jgi:hypothetical protein
VPFKTRQSLGASVSASFTVYPIHYGYGDDSLVTTPISFVGSRVPRAYPLRQETGNVTRHASQNHYFPAYPLSPCSPPTRREHSTDKYPRSTLSLCIPKLRTPYENRDRCRPNQPSQPVSRKPRRTCTRPCFEWNRCPTVRQGSTFTRSQDLIDYLVVEDPGVDGGAAAQGGELNARISLQLTSMLKWR